MPQRLLEKLFFFFFFKTDLQEVSTGPASTLIDLGVGGHTADSGETPASSVLENELKALGKYCGIYLFNHGCHVKRREA